MSRQDESVLYSLDGSFGAFILDSLVPKGCRWMQCGRWCHFLLTVSPSSSPQVPVLPNHMAAMKSKKRYGPLYLAVYPTMALNPHLAAVSRPQQPTLMVVKVGSLINYDISNDPEIAPPKQLSTSQGWL